MYHYVATLDFPYTVGCLKGTWSQEDVRTISGPPPAGRAGPPERLASICSLGKNQRSLRIASSARS